MARADYAEEVMKSKSIPSEEWELTCCPCCGMACRDEDLLMCLGCGSVYCGQGRCQVVCPCQDDDAAPTPSRPTKELFARVVNGNPFAVIIKDGSGRVIHATERGSILNRWLGHSSSEVIGKTNFDLLQPSEAITMGRLECAVTAKLKSFRFVANLTASTGRVNRFMVEIAPFQMTPGDYLTITTVTPAAASRMPLPPGARRGPLALQATMPSK